MKIQFFNLLILSIAIVVCSASQAVCSDSVPAYQVEVQLFPESQQLEGIARLNVSDSLISSWSELRLSAQAELLSVTLAGQSLNYRFLNGILRLHLDNLSVPDSAVLTIHYRVRYADPLPETTVGMENPSFGVSATISEVGTYLSSGTAWFPQLRIVPERSRIRIEGPAGLYGVTAGKLLEHGTANGSSHTLWETSFPLEGLALSAGYYQIFEEQAGDIQVLAFLTEKNAALASTYLDPTSKYLQFYQRLLGPYPFAKFAVVENFLPTGYGLPSWTLLGSNVIALPFIPHTSLPHEIVHSWYGNAVEVNYQAGNWAEGLTSYLSDYLLKEQRSDEQGREYRLKLLRDYAALVTEQNDYPLNRFVSRTSKSDQAIGYGKSAMMFHMLRRQIGEEAFWSSLRRLAVEGSQKRLGWNDLKKLFSAESGRDLDPFFHQWVEQSGAPQLHFDGVSVAEEDGRWEVQGTVVQSGAPYQFELPLQLKTEAGVVEQSIVVKQRRTSFALQSDVPVMSLSGDPDAHTFRQLLPGELPATINDLRASSNLLVVVPSAQSPLLAASMDLLRGLQKLQTRVVTWQEYNPAMSEQFDLLFIGCPPAEKIKEARIADLRTAQDAFYWDKNRYQDAMDSLFVCLKTAGDSQRLMAIFHPLSFEAARKVARKIPHYGRYSYLVFKDGANLVKGTNDPGQSPLRIKLN